MISQSVQGFPFVLLIYYIHHIQEGSTSSNLKTSVEPNNNKTQKSGNLFTYVNVCMKKKKTRID